MTYRNLVRLMSYEFQEHPGIAVGLVLRDNYSIFIELLPV
jgi:hypothetical protein